MQSVQDHDGWQSQRVIAWHLDLLRMREANTIARSGEVAGGKEMPLDIEHAMPLPRSVMMEE